MIVICIIFLVFFILYRLNKDKDNVLSDIIMVFLFYILSCLFYHGFTLIFYSKPELEWVLKNSTEIVALGNSKNIDGSFFLGSGYIGEKAVYYYMKKYNGGFVMDHVDANDAIIYEDDTQPRIEEYFAGFKNKKDAYWYVFPETKNAGKIQIHIPKGSINKEFRVNL